MRKLSLPLSIAATLLSATPQTALAQEAGGGTVEVRFVPMDEIRVPIIDGSRANGVLRLKLVVQTADDTAAEKVRAILPMLRATALASALEFARLYASPFTPVDASRLAEQMTASLRARNAGISRVLLTEVAATRS